MQYLYYDIESFSFESKNVNEDDLKENNFLKKVVLKESAKNKYKTFTVFNFRLLNDYFPIPLKNAEIFSLEVFNENDGKMLDLNNFNDSVKQHIAKVSLSTTINSYRNYKTFEFNTLVPTNEMDLILSETKYIKMIFLFEDIEGNKVKVFNTIYFKKISLKPKSNIKYRKVQKCITEIVKN